MLKKQLPVRINPVPNHPSEAMGSQQVFQQADLPIYSREIGRHQ